MSPRSPRRRARAVRRASAPALGVAALAATALVAVAPAGAATPRFSTIEQPLQATSTARTASGDGRVAWAVPEQESGNAPVTSEALWTVRDGAAVRVTSVPAGDAGALRLEVGVATGGAAVAVVRTTVSEGRTLVIRLVNLDTGATQTFSSTRRGLRVGGVALDHGRLYYTLHVAKVGKRNTSALWRAPLTGLRLGTAKKIRTSQRGETWSDVLADRNRVAIRTSHPVRSGGRPGRLEQIAFGTPLGAWSRTGDVLFQEGPVSLVDVAGFTEDRSAVVTLQSPEGGTLRATATPIAPKGHSRSALLGTSGADSITGASFVPATGRFLGVGPDAAGTRSVGFTAPVFAPGGDGKR